MNSNQSFHWPDTAIARLKVLYADGLAGSEIARVLAKEFRADISRNSVIGKLHRLKLFGGKKVAPKTTKPPKPRMDDPEARKLALERQRQANRANMPKAKPRPLPAALTAPLRPVEVEVPTNRRIPLLALTEQTCRWPNGDPGDDDFGFCGHGPRVGSPYCEYHARVAYQPVVERRVPKARAA